MLTNSEVETRAGDALVQEKTAPSIALPDTLLAASSQKPQRGYSNVTNKPLEAAPYKRVS
ncbi:hypothetical protein [Shewanella fodinae]|uniref:hypothetical protein n=1 Tax=Shewanella fodinae TaxID=552357 RepID=UPI001674F204|nr:hypothetical protein [Shewanella fodinae]MCL2905197.1 hypothetical protein [Shewanella fodinae]